MKKTEEGFTNPLGSSAYFPPPYPFKNAETVLIEFEAPQEAMEAELPEPLELEPGTAFAVIQDAQIASGAPFHEGYIFLRTKYKGQNGFYSPYVFGCPEEAVLANREMYGWPEMIADYPHPRMTKDGHTVTATVQRRGELLMSQARGDAKHGRQPNTPQDSIPTEGRATNSTSHSHPTRRHTTLRSLGWKRLLETRGISTIQDNSLAANQNSKRVLYGHILDTAPRESGLGRLETSSMVSVSPVLSDSSERYVALRNPPSR
jgi:hypothetical protein